MIRIAIIFMLSSLTNCDNHKDYKLDLSTVYNSLLEVNLYMSRQIMENDSAIFFGNTKSGRSTLINYIMGNELIGVRQSIYNPIEIIARNESIGPKIGRGSLTETSIPSSWTSKLLPNLTLWDTPPFDDNRGAVRDITNSFYLYNLVRKVKSLKIILVVDINDITQDNTQQFMSLITSVETLFGNGFKNYFNSTTVIFTKVPTTTYDDQPIDNEYINYHLQNHLLLDTGLKWSEVLKRFIEFIIHNKDRVALFKKLNHPDNVTKDIDDNIFPAIRNSESINSSSLQNVRPRISAASMLELFKTKQTLQTRLIVEGTEKLLLKKLKNTMDVLDKLNNKIDKNNITAIKTNLTEDLIKLTESLTYENNITKKVDSFIAIDSDLNVTEKENLKRNVELIQKVADLLNVTISKALEFTVDSYLLTLSLKYQAAISLVDVKLGIISEQEFLDRKKEEDKLAQNISIAKEQLNELDNTNNKSVWDIIIENISDFFREIKSWFTSKESK
ncbi:uncharacterized protein LOC122502679 [Leptopilina heterotoma]|uniref:uncharacterized protein LOC122502679 n=1 Tax=Leptopilina heterotoma TaxID=63436 RepID=UPI001CA801B0|nr:uncharacterized protein LOC122502679 [Leptopilina heterotoma]XP_043468777.1 uncharacterized protein LOC122502679 [Leptopilina heterotoma]